MEEGHSAFHRLVSGLSQSDKKKLLEKIRVRTALSDAPLVDKEAEEKPDTVEKRYEKLRWYKRLWYWFLGMISGKTPEEVFLNVLVSAEGKKIELLFPDIIDSKERLLKEKFQAELIKLKKAARFFYSALDASVNRDRGAFTGYLGSIIIPDVHNALTEASDPEKPQSAADSGQSDTKIISRALERIEDIIIKIPEHERAAMYDQARMIYCLKELACYLYDRLIISFTKSEEQENPVCPLAVVSDQLISLDNILFSIRKAPSSGLLSALFIFCMEEHRNDSGFDQESELQKFIQSAGYAVSVIRNFRRNVPLTMIIRYSIRNLSWEPAGLGGGEDWLQVYRNYWIEAAKSRYLQWKLQKKEAGLAEESETLFKGVTLLKLNNIRDEEGGGIPVSGALSLAFFLTFHKYIFMPVISASVRPVLINGEFHRRDTGTLFAESYNDLIGLDADTGRLDKALSPDGEFGKQWEQLNTDVQPVSARKRKIRIITEEANSAVNKVIAKADSALAAIHNIISAILAKTADGSGVLDNFRRLQSTVPDITGSLEETVRLLDNAMRIRGIIKDIEAIKSGGLQKRFDTPGAAAA